MNPLFDGRDYHLIIDAAEFTRFRSPRMTEKELTAPIRPWNRNLQLRTDITAHLALALTASNEPDSISLIYKSPGDIYVAIGRGAHKELHDRGVVVNNYDGQNKICLRLYRPPLSP